MPRHRRLLPIVLLLAGLPGCASVGEPAWLRELRAREAEALPAQKIESSDRFFRARVPAKLAAAVAQDGEAYHVSLDAGATAPVDCWVYRDGIDLAGSLSGLSQETFTGISKQLGEIEARQVDRVDAGAIGENPFLAIDWMYRVRTDAGPQMGQVKHLVASKGGRGLYCQHNEVGYARTFRRVAGALLESLEYRKPNGAAPYFAEISTMSLRGMRVGLQHTTLTRDRDGDTRVDTRTSMLLPVTADTLQASDTFAVEFARPDGSLINQVHVETANGELVSNLHLDPQPGGAWSVEGTFQGKPLSTRIESASQPSSWLGDAIALRETLASGGSGARIATTRWIPDADPTRLLDGTISIGEPVGSERFAATLATEGIEADLVVERTGTVASGSIDMGVANVDFERVYTGGAF
jgi:hypothetical protein